jgi:hypothetical protein
LARYVTHVVDEHITLGDVEEEEAAEYDIEHCGAVA